MTKMASYLSPQTTDPNGYYPRLIHAEVYPPNVGTLNLAQTSIIRPMDTPMSPPLSAIELADLHESEIEFSTGETRIYNNVSGLINELHTERLRFQRENRE